MKKEFNWPINDTGLLTRILAVLSLSLFFAAGCSSSPSKTASTEAPRMESHEPEDSRKNSGTVSASEPVLSNSPQPAQSPRPSTSPKVAESAEKSSVATSSQKTRKPYKRKASQSAKKDNSLDALLGTSPTMTAQESSSGSSIRGLSPVSESYGKDHKIPRDILDSVRRMEEFEISADEIERFRKEGELTTPAH